MIRSILFILCVASTLLTQGQNQFELGKVNAGEISMKSYELDTSAVAVVLNEFGNAFVGGEGYNRIIFDYYLKLKILRTEGLSEANIEIPLRKGERVGDRLVSVSAASYNIENSALVSNQMDSKQIFTENHENYDVKKLAIPNVKVGSVVEVVYQIETPYMFNFWPWEFQSEIPKIRSEYWAKIPGNYNYNVSLRGFLTLSKNEQTIVRQCIHSGSGLTTNYAADCIQYKFAMKNIPAFVEEDYMTAKKNFLSALRFELAEVKSFDGRVDKVTKEWKDAEDELRKHENFGLQLKKCKDIERQAEAVVAGTSKPLDKAKKVYEMVQEWYGWNDDTYFLCDVGVKKAFDTRKGNIADINLSLVAALRAVGLKAEPLLLSTREHGAVTELHPVLSDFNYVLAVVKIDGKDYLLDGSNDWLPFGMIPIKCLNGKGRVFEEKNSYWLELTPSGKDKLVAYMDVTLDSDGYFRGKTVNTYSGYGGYTKRADISQAGGKQEYVDGLNKKGKTVTIEEFTLDGLDNLESDVRETFQVEIEGIDNMNSKAIIFNPFFSHRYEQNPFRSSERHYPVDFATPIEAIYVITITVPEEYEVTELPETTALALPNSGGRFLFDVKQLGNKITLNYSLTIARTLFSSKEYFSLKELFSRIIQIQNFDLIYTRKS